MMIYTEIITKKQFDDIAESVHVAIKAITGGSLGYMLLLPGAMLEGEVIEDGKAGVLLATNYEHKKQVIPLVVAELISGSMAEMESDEESSNAKRAATQFQDKFPVSDWKYEVANGDTVLGYAEWLEHRVEGDEDEEC